MTKLAVKQIQHLKALAHNINPVVIIGDNGLTEAVIKEINLNLVAHELIKVRVLGADREFRSGIVTEICEQTNSLLVQHIGKLLVLYRKSDKNKIALG